MDADKRGSETETEEKRFRGPNKKIFAALDRLGYIPPHCTEVRIRLPVAERPKIIVEAIPSEDDLKEFVATLTKADVVVQVMDLR